MSTDKYDEMAREIADQRWGSADPFWNRKGDFEFALASALRQVAQEKERETLERAAKVCEALMIEAHWGYYNAPSDDAARDCAKAIRALSPTPTEDVPTPTELVDGYVRVPREPTLAQLRAGHKAAIRWENKLGELIDGNSISDCYRAMIQAAEKGE